MFRLSHSIHIPLTFILLTSIFLVNSSVLAQTPSHEPTQNPTSGQSLSTTPIEYNTLYASANTNLWKLEPYSNVGDTLIGPIGTSGTDIAFDGTTLYGVNFSQLFTIDPTTGTGTNYKNITGYSDVNALTIGLDGTMYAGTISGALLRIDKDTGNPTLIGYYGPGLGSSGDLAITPDDIMYATVTRSGYYTDWLARINMQNGSATPIGTTGIGYSGVYGLDFKDWSLYGVTSFGELIEINTTTGIGTLIKTDNASFWGLSTSGPAIVGSITSPSDYYSTGSATIPIVANVQFPNGSYNRQVEYYVFYNRIWHSLGIVKGNTNPYTWNWVSPTDLNDSISQIVNLRIDISYNDAQNNVQRASYLGGLRHIIFDKSMTDPSITENWIANRYYLNQRSLGSNGDNLCSVTSLAMFLAMEGKINPDYLSMAAEAFNMVNDVYNNNGNGPSVPAVLAKLKEYNTPNAFEIPGVPTTQGWGYLKAYIDFHIPVIVSSVKGAVFKYGHFVVAVGYEESPTHHYMITYDPFGQWRGSDDNFYANHPNDPASHVGKWVYYDLGAFTNNQVYMVGSIPPPCDPSSDLPLCQKPTSQAQLSPSVLPTSLTPPDETSGETLISGIFDGKDFSPFTNIYLPLVNH